MLVPGYDHDQLIARHRFARVYRAHQRSFDRDVTITVLEVVPTDDDGRRRFAERCAAMGRLTGHPGILTVLDSGFTDGGHPYVITPSCPDGSVADRLAAEGPLGVHDVVRIGVVVADAIAVAHRAGLLHLDITPAHIVVTPFGQPALTDFGLSDLTGVDPLEITAAVAIDHVPPEVLDGATPTAASDVYALGSTLWTLLAGHPPFPDDGGGLGEQMRRVHEEPLPSLDRDDVPAELEALLAAMVAKDPDERPDAGVVGPRLASVPAQPPPPSPADAEGADGAGVAAAGVATGVATDRGAPAFDRSDQDLTTAGPGTGPASAAGNGNGNGHHPDPGHPDPGGDESGRPTEPVAPLPLISPDPRPLLAGGDPFAPAAATVSVAGNPELGPPAPPAPWQGRLTTWDDLAAQPVSREVPTAGGPSASSFHPGPSAVAGTSSVPWADAATATLAAPAAVGPPAPAPGAPTDAPRPTPIDGGDGDGGGRRRWPVLLATMLVMLVAAGVTLAVLSRSRNDQETLRSIDDAAPLTTTTTAAVTTTGAPTTNAVPAPPPPSAAPTTPAPTAAPTSAAPAAVAVPAGTGQVVLAPGVDPAAIAEGSIVQQAATALADGSWATARSLIPDLGSTSDQALVEGWGNLEHATVVVTGSRPKGGNLEVRIGVVAHERNLDGSPRTNLYCATWVLQGNQIVDMKDDQSVGGQPWKAGTWADPAEGIDLLRRSCRPLR